MLFDPLSRFRRADGRTFRVDPSLLWQPFRERLFVVIRRCHERGHDYYATSGTRWWAEQAELHQRHLAGGPLAAPPGCSSHQFGLAVDLAPDADESKPGLQGPDYSARAYDVLVEEAQRAGLVSGRSFRDDPHVQVPRFVSARALQPLRKLWIATPGANMEKLTACWGLVERVNVLPALVT